MKTITIIQARMGSTRLPGKVMKRLCYQTVLAHVVTRVKACSRIDEIIMAEMLNVVTKLMNDKFSTLILLLASKI